MTTPIVDDIFSFDKWFNDSKLGDRCVYHIGYIAHDRPNMTTETRELVNYVRRLGTPTDCEVYKIHKKAGVGKKGLGWGKLFQRRETPFTHFYIFEKG